MPKTTTRMVGADAVQEAVPGAVHGEVPEGVLRVCADPNNLPYSNAKGDGFENKIAGLLADRLHAKLVYTWHAQRRGFLRQTLLAGQCDVAMGISGEAPAASLLQPYYRSTHVFVTREDSKLDLRSFDDPALRNLRIGVHLAGGDYSSTPPAVALVRRGLVRNISGFSLFDNYANADPSARLIEAVADRRIDVAALWGPVGGYFAGRQSVRLRVRAVAEEMDNGIPLAWSVGIAVRKGEEAFQRRVQEAMDALQPRINQILAEYSLPLRRMDL